MKPKTTLGYSYPDRLRKFTPDMWPDLADDEMRITFLGTFAGPPVRRAQQQMSIFVEVGPWTPEPPDPSKGFGKATDSFVFDLRRRLPRQLRRDGDHLQQNGQGLH